MDIRFAEFSLPQSGAVVVGVWEERVLTPSARRLDEATGGAVARAVAAAARFHGKKNELVPLIGPPGLPLSRIVLAGLGKPEAVDARLLEDLGGNLAAHLNGAGETEASFAIDLGDGAPVKPAEAAARLAFGAALRAYRFDKYRTKQKPEQKPSLAAITVAAPAPDQAKKAYRALGAAADSIAFARDLVSEPANELYPESMAERAAALAGPDLPGLTVEILDDNRMRELGMGALLAVGQGSVRPPRVVVMQYRGAAADVAPLGFIGKGVTFDTGGISIKPAAGMADMKWDMAGAGVVIGLLRLLAARKARVNAVGIVGLVENMPSGNAQRPGDIVRSMSGQTIEVLNTDAEGRLVLIAAGKAVGEPLWRLPLGDTYDRAIDSDAADVKNIAGDRAAGSIIGAQFVQRFVNNVPWAHLDIAGVAWSKKDAPTVPKGATAFGVRLLDRFVADYYEKE